MKSTNVDAMRDVPAIAPYEVCGSVDVAKGGLGTNRSDLYVLLWSCRESNPVMAICELSGEPFTVRPIDSTEAQMRTKLVVG